ncbi:unnamed protein product, partial [Closterium sp. NIES-53]
EGEAARAGAGGGSVHDSQGAQRRHALGPGAQVPGASGCAAQCEPRGAGRPGAGGVAPVHPQRHQRRGVRRARQRGVAGERFARAAEQGGDATLHMGGRGSAHVEGFYGCEEDGLEATAQPAHARVTAPPAVRFLKPQPHPLAAAAAAAALLHWLHQE